MNLYYLGLYEKALPEELSWECKFETAATYGFDGIELSIDESDKRLSRLSETCSEVKDIKRAMNDTGLPIRTMCLSGHRRFPFGSHDRNTRERARQILQSAVLLASALGIRIIQLAGYDVYYENHDEETEQWFLDGIEHAANFAASYGVALGFETMETAFMDTVEKAMAIAKKINSPYLGLYPDIGNLKNAAELYQGDVVEDLRLGTGHIWAAHLKETRTGTYRDMRIGNGHTEYEKSLQELWNQGVRMFVGEFWYHDGDDYANTIQNAAVFLRKKIANRCSLPRVD